MAKEKKEYKPFIINHFRYTHFKASHGYSLFLLFHVDTNNKIEEVARLLQISKQPNM